MQKSDHQWNTTIGHYCGQNLSLVAPIFEFVTRVGLPWWQSDVHLSLIMLMSWHQHFLGPPKIQNCLFLVPESILTKYFNSTIHQCSIYMLFSRAKKSIELPLLGMAKNFRSVDLEKYHCTAENDKSGIDTRFLHTCKKPRV